MADVREAILARLKTICDTVGTANNYTVFRNAPEVSGAERPLINLIDGEEEADPSDPNKYGPRARRRIHMQPDVTILEDTNTENEIGPALSAIRAKMIHAILTDETLLALAANKSVGYVGLSQYGENGLHVHGAMVLTFHIIYDFVVADIAS